MEHLQKLTKHWAKKEVLTNFKNLVFFLWSQYNYARN